MSARLKSVAYKDGKGADNFATWCPGDWRSGFEALVLLCEAEGYEVGIAGAEIHFVTRPASSRFARHRRRRK